MTSGKCGACKTYDRIKKCCKLEPFEGQYDDDCPKYEESTLGIIGLTLGLIVTGILWAAHIALGIIAFWGMAILAILIGTKMVKVMGVILLLVSTISCMVWCGNVMEQPVIETPEPVAIQPTVAQPAEVPVEKSPQVDPWKSREPETEYELLQAASAIVMANEVSTDFETGFVLMAKKSGSGYKTFVWAADNGLIVVIDPMDDSCQLVMKSDHDRKYSNWHIKYVSWSEYERIIAEYPNA